MKLLILVLCFIIPSNLVQAQWKFESGSVAFSIKNAGLTVTGSFSGMKASIRFDPTQLATCTMEATVESATIETGINLRNKHLKKAEYLNAEKFFLVQMKLKRMEKEGNNLKGTFLLTLKGISKELVMPIVFSETGKAASLKGNFTLNRRDYQIGGNSWTMSDEVKIEITANLSRLKS